MKFTKKPVKKLLLPSLPPNLTLHRVKGAQLGEREISVEINCRFLEQDYFTFLSDRTDTTDSNSDGLIISGMQTSDKFLLTITADGETYSTGKLASFEKSANGARGSGSLFHDGPGSTQDVEFTVVCQK